MVSNHNIIVLLIVDTVSSKKRWKNYCNRFHVDWTAVDINFNDYSEIKFIRSDLVASLNQNHNIIEQLPGSRILNRNRT